MTHINDGTGGNYAAAVSPTNRVAVTSVAVPVQGYISATTKRAFQAPSGIQTLSAAGAHGVLSLRNTGDEDLFITYMRIAIDKTEVGQALVEVLIGGDWNGGGTQVDDPCNLNTGSVLSSGIEAWTDTVPDNAKVIDARWVKGADEVVYNKHGSIVIVAGGALTFRVTTETAGVKAHARASFVLIPGGTQYL